MSVSVCACVYVCLRDMKKIGKGREGRVVCVCVCERKKETDRERDRQREGRDSKQETEVCAS